MPSIVAVRDAKLQVNRESDLAARGAKRKAKRAKEDLYRQLILDAAESVFARKGYDATKIGEIAQESGVSLQTLYSVFPGKLAIYEAVHASGDEELHRRAIESSQGETDPLAALLAGLRAATLFFLDHPDFLRLRLHGGFTWGTEAVAAGSRRRSRAWRAALEMVRLSCQRCIEAGIFVDRDPSLLARMVVSIQQVELAHWLEGGMCDDPEVVANAIEDQIERAFRLSVS